MYRSVYAYFSIFSVILLNSRISSKTYYFNKNKTTNEFTVYNRVNVVSSAQNYPARLYLNELKNISRSSLNVIKKEDFPIIDEEWGNDVENMTFNEELPKYIHKLYESIAAEVHEDQGPIRILFNIKPENSTALKFNLSSLDVREKIIEVDLNFYFTVKASWFQKPLVLRLYEIEKGHINETSLINPDAHKLLNVIYILQAESGWQVFKIKSTVENWLLDEEANFGLLLTISKPNENNFTIYKDDNNGTFRTFAVVKTSDILTKKADGNTTIEHSNSCTKTYLYIDLEHSEWFDFVIAPKGYQALKCSGKCDPTHTSLTNHKKMLQYASQTDKKKPMCCVPVAYHPLPMMFYDKYGNIALKVYKEMVVAHCGCR